MTLGPPSRRNRLAALVAVAAWANAGCSLLFVDGPPAQHRKMPYFECTSGRGWPIVDGIIGVTTAVEAVAIVSVTDHEEARTAAIVAGAEAALFLASMAYGASKTSECREAKEALMLRLGQMQLQGGGQPGWGPPSGAAPYDPWAPPPGTLRPPPAAPPQAPAPGATP